jgi:hypothetical protein
VDGDSFTHLLRREREDSPSLTKLAFYRSCFVDWTLLEWAGLTQSLYGSWIAVFVESDMTFWAVEEGIVLFVVRTKASCTCSFEDAFGILPCLLTLLSLYILLELLLVSNSPWLLRLNTAVLLYSIKIGEVVQVINLEVIECDSKVFTYKTSNVSIFNWLNWG